MKCTMIALVTALAVGRPLVSLAADAQSLADVARQEEARRKAIKQPARVYTNDDLKRYQPLSTLPAAEPAPPPPQAAPPAPKPPEPAAPQEPVKDEAYWRARVGDVRTRIDRAQLQIDALQTQANSLYADFVNRDDPVQRLQLEARRQKVLAELDRTKTELVELQKAAADIEEEARRAGVPPGWLR